MIRRYRSLKVFAANISRVPSRLMVTGDSPYPNAKVYSLELMLGCRRE